jgi:hypothetical protein
VPQVSLSLGPGEPEVLNFKRRKVCKEKGQPAEGLVSSPSAPLPDNQGGDAAVIGPLLKWKTVVIWNYIMKLGQFKNNS